MADRQMAALRQLEEVPLAGEAGALLPRLPIGLSATPPAIQGPPPELGQHTREILSEAGYRGTEIDDLERARICGAPAPLVGETKCKR
jgi:crotonobetainyl-CoA:carnitine CoA-transferase CaiB-like acyl-CoA transferase